MKTGKPFKQFKRFSQVFLVDQEILKKEADIIAPTGKSVLEIGGGSGSLTSNLIALKPKRLIIIEYDKRFADILTTKFSNVSGVEIHVINNDFLKISQSDNKIFEDTDIICGNIPYHITSDIIFKLVDWTFEKAVIMVQKEVADRIVDEFEQGYYSRLNVMANYYFECSKALVVPKSCFSPVPLVDSELIILERRRNIKRNVAFEHFIRTLFTHQKKTLRNAFADAYKEFGFDSKQSARGFADTLEFKDTRVFYLNIAQLIIIFKKFYNSRSFK